jgi:hypothetical protein
VSRDGRGRDERGVTVALNYVLVLGISATLVSGLLLAGGTFVEDQRERVIESELTVIGNHIASNIEQVDRMANASGSEPDTAYVNQTFQTEVTGSSYTVELSQDRDQVVLTSASPGMTVRVNVTVGATLDSDSFATGGEISAIYDPDAAGGDGRLQIDNA